MVTHGWKSLTEAEPRSNGKTRIVSDSVEHLGIRNALRDAYNGGDEIPPEFAKLLNRIR
jgi:hypothetical protein